MRCRVIFSSIAFFPNLPIFLHYFRERILPASSRDADANFFLFGEDILAVMDGKARPVPYEEAVSFLPSLQAALGPNDFVIFSIYCTAGSALCNASFLIGRKQWYFDLKHTISFGDVRVLYSGGRPKEKSDADMAAWKVNAILARRSVHCLKAGKVCIKNVRTLVCTDLALLSRMNVGRNFLVFAPANDLDPKVLSDYLPAFRESGYVFINDPKGGDVWTIPFGKAKKPAPLAEGPRRWYNYLDFELA